MRIFLRRCLRVLRVAAKPSREEFAMSARITGIGILLIGAIGFIIFILFKIPGMV